MPCRVRILLPPTAVLHLVPAQEGYTPLFMACENGHVDVVKELLTCGAAVDKADQVHCGAAALLCWSQHTLFALFTRSWRVIRWHPSPLPTPEEHYACADTLLGLCPWRFALLPWGMIIQCLLQATLYWTGVQPCNQFLCLRLLASALAALVCHCPCRLLVEQAALITPADASSSALHDGQGNTLLSEYSVCGHLMEHSWAMSTLRHSCMCVPACLWALARACEECSALWHDPRLC